MSEGVLDVHAHAVLAASEGAAGAAGPELGTADDPAVAVRTVFATAAAWARDNPRGCAFVNAWAEISASPEHQALAVIREEKRWMRRPASSRSSVLVA